MNLQTFFFKQIIDFVYQGQKVYLFRPSYIIYGDTTMILIIIICNVRRRIRHHFGCCIRLLHHAVSIDYMNVHFLIMHQISTRNKRYNTFSGK
jgi:hypothetical protein